MEDFWHVLDRDNDHPKPVSHEEYERWLKHKERVGVTWRILQSRVAGLFVSTVFLGLDHGMGQGPPVLWETMIFGNLHGDEFQERYTSHTEAVRRHLQILEHLAHDRPLAELPEREECAP